MKTYSQQEILDRYDTLPDALKKAIADDMNATKVLEIGKRHNLTLEQTGAVASETGYVLLGITKPADLARQFIIQANVSETTAKAIVGDINQEIFRPVWEHLRGLHGLSETTPAPSAPTPVSVVPETSALAPKTSAPPTPPAPFQQKPTSPTAPRPTPATQNLNAAAQKPTTTAAPIIYPKQQITDAVKPFSSSVPQTQASTAPSPTVKPSEPASTSKPATVPIKISSTTPKPPTPPPTPIQKGAAPIKPETPLVLKVLTPPPIASATPSRPSAMSISAAPTRGTAPQIPTAPTPPTRVTPNETVRITPALSTLITSKPEPVAPKPPATPNEMGGKQIIKIEATAETTGGRSIKIENVAEATIPVRTQTPPMTPAGETAAKSVPDEPATLPKITAAPKTETLTPPVVATNIGAVSSQTPTSPSPKPTTPPAYNTKDPYREPVDEEQVS